MPGSPRAIRLMAKLHLSTEAEFAAAPRKVDFIMEKTPGGELQLWGCRGEGKGCKRNKFRSARKHCQDCVLADNPEETLADFEKRLRLGN